MDIEMSTEPITPLRLGIAGLTHDHVRGLLRQADRDDIDIVGIYEPDADVVQRYAERFEFDTNLFHADLNNMLDATKPEAVMAFGSIYDHLHVVETCAPRGIHVMVEKPLAVNMDHAQKMAALARQHNIHLLTNYETTWYASTDAAHWMIFDEERIGQIRKIVVHDGHRGPAEIGMQPEFLAWLTDPVQNGGGAVIDFGCYGVNLITWLMNNTLPDTVTGILQQLKPDVYPNVDDEATIILTYPHTQGIVQGSWNWPVGRKDMEIYGQTGYIYALDALNMCFRQTGDEITQTLKLEPLPAPLNDPFAYFAAVVRGTVAVTDHDLSSLANNLIVVQILDAARESARTGQTVRLPHADQE